MEGIYLSEPNQNRLSVDASNDSFALARREFEHLKTTGGATTPIYRLYTGQRYAFEGLNMDVVFTQDTLPIASYKHKDVVNTTTTGLMFTTDTGHKIYIGGDQTTDNTNWIQESYGVSLFSDLNVFATFHHGSYNVTDFVKWMGRSSTNQFDVVLYPTRSIPYVDTTGSINYYLNQSAKKSYAFGDGTTGGTAVLTFTESGIDSKQLSPNTWKYHAEEARPEG